jgi:5-hydroxyisourate hydrolase-like protein (transthyretin family)
MNKFITLLFLSLMVFFSDAIASTTVDGTVVDAETKKPIADVTVIAINPITKVEHAATTDAKGSFKLNTLAPGIYTIKFKKEDYLATEKNKLQVAAKTSHHLNIELSPLVEEDDHYGWRNKGRYGFINMW